MAVDRLVPTSEGADIIDLVREIAREELAARRGRRGGREFPREVFRCSGRPACWGCRIRRSTAVRASRTRCICRRWRRSPPAWMSVGVGVSVHSMTCYALARFGTGGAAPSSLPDMIGGDQLGAYALSEPQAGSDIAGITTRAKTATGTRPHRDQGVGHPRLAGRLLHHLRPDRRDPKRGLSCSTSPATRQGSASVRRSGRWA